MDDFREKLIADVIGEDSDPAMREALLGQTLRLARSKRRLRKLRRAMPAVAAVAALLLATAHFFRPGPLAPTPSRSDVPPFSASESFVRTQPLPLSAVVTTKPLDTAAVVQ